MPGAPHRAVDQKPFCKRAMVVRTVGAHRKDIVALPRQQDFVVTDMSDEHRAVGKVSDRDTLCQIRPCGFGLFFRHSALPVDRI